MMVPDGAGLHHAAGQQQWQPPHVEVVISGFGSFHNVPANPTARVVSWLQQQYGAGGPGAPHAPPPRALRHGRIHSCTILKASARAVNAYLVQQLEELKRRGVAACAAGAAAAAGGPPVVLLLHFGADVHVSSFCAAALCGRVAMPGRPLAGSCHLWRR